MLCRRKEDKKRGNSYEQLLQNAFSTCTELSSVRFFGEVEEQRPNGKQQLWVMGLKLMIVFIIDFMTIFFLH